jgi:bifunctional non-homologous end joining protein LigD
VGLREDISARSVGDEMPQAPPGNTDSNEVQGIVITHPDRVIWPQLGITKLELARYVGEVGEWMLPQVANRPLTLLRCPDGAEAKCFYQRHPGSGAMKGQYLFVNSIPALVSLAQNGVIEMHTWGVTLPDARHPDRITLDLDPDAELPWEELRAATALTKTLLDGLKLKSFLKTTGGKGFHVVVPILPRLGWDEVKDFSRLIAGMLAKARPDLFTAKMAKQKRAGKVYVDYLRNAETASAVAAYSPRARPGATVSTPLAWDELDKTDLRAKFTVRSVPRRLAQLRHDPWRDYFATRQSITPAMRRALGAN